MKMLNRFHIKRNTPGRFLQGMYNSRKRQFIVVVLLLSLIRVPAQPLTKSKSPLVIGEARTIHSLILKEDRLLNIYLPDSFSDKKVYPVFYLLDGAMNEDFPHIAGLLQFFHLSCGMPEAILVGIVNVDRRRDFTFPTSVKELNTLYTTSGHSDVFIRFMENELLPYIRSQYRTGDSSYLIGQSLGGLLAGEILLKKPEMFSHYLIVSPSLWWDNESLPEATDSLMRRRGMALEGKNVFISVGGKEDPVMQRDAKGFAEKLNAPRLKRTRVRFMSLPGENHATILHQAIDEDLKQLFPFKE